MFVAAAVEIELPKKFQAPFVVNVPVEVIVPPDKVIGRYNVSDWLDSLHDRAIHGQRVVVPIAQGVAVAEVQDAVAVDDDGIVLQTPGELLPLCRVSVPPFTEVVPLKMLALARIRLALPAIASPPAPLTTPLKDVLPLPATVSSLPLLLMAPETPSRLAELLSHVCGAFSAMDWPIESAPALESITMPVFALPFTVFVPISVSV